MGLPLGVAVQLLPTPTTRDHKGHNQRGDGSCLAGALLPTPRATDGTKGGPNQRGSSGDLMLPSAVALLPTPRASRGASDTETVDLLPTPTTAPDTGNGHARNLGAEIKQWGKYAAAITHWEALTRPAPEPTVPGKNGRQRLNPQFSEWMMGWPEGWVTDVPGMRDTWKHHAIGNGVVPGQAAAAIRRCLNALGLTATHQAA